MYVYGGTVCTVSKYISALNQVRTAAVSELAFRPDSSSKLRVPVRYSYAVLYAVEHGIRDVMMIGWFLTNDVPRLVSPSLGSNWGAGLGKCGIAARKAQYAWRPESARLYQDL